MSPPDVRQAITGVCVCVCVCVQGALCGAQEINTADIALVRAQCYLVRPQIVLVLGLQLQKV